MESVLIITLNTILSSCLLISDLKLFQAPELIARPVKLPELLITHVHDPNIPDMYSIKSGSSINQLDSAI